jgi:peptide/nickel transport system substrate-binding protein
VIALLFNSNPRKARNRELLNPQVRQALDLAVDRSSIISVVFRGGAVPWGNWISPYSGSWASPSVKPPPFDVARANAMLDSLGFKRGPDGVRVVPLTTGRYAQPAHQMSYEFAVPGDMPFGGSRIEQILAQDWSRVGVAVHENDIGDTAASYSHYQGPSGSYQNYDLGIWYYVGYEDPSFMLALPTRAQWGNYNDTGYANPAYDRLFALQARTGDQARRRAVVWQMEQILARDLPYAPLVNLNLTFAYDDQWTHVNPALYGYKSFFEQLRGDG